MVPYSAALGTDELERTPMPDVLTDELSINPLAGPQSTSSLVLFHSSEPNSSDPFEDASGPVVGGSVLGFELVCELGRGGFARVFLARETALSDRLVVLKLSYRPSGEAERLALLRHSNVVPVYSVHRAGALQVICMPYFGRTTLADLLLAHNLGPSAGEPLAEPNVPNPVRDPAAVLRVLSGLAAGLQHAHECGILHLDIKPSNVLLVDTGEPLLFDFNLSLDGTRGDRDSIGGTKPYMSIEQMRALAEHDSARVDARSDLYSLGVTAFELLTGALPFPHASSAPAADFVAARASGPPALRALNPAVSPAVEAIVRKLLAPNPADRYQSAAQLREDIELHLADLPLKHAPNRWRERFAKRRRRNPWLPARLVAAVIVGLALALGGVKYTTFAENRRTTATAVADTIAKKLAAVRLDLLVPDPTTNARAARAAEAELAVYGLPARANWREQPVLAHMADADRTTAVRDLGELMGLLAHTQWRAADGLPAGARRAAAESAWQLNTLARGCFAPGTVPFLDRQAAELAPHAGKKFDPPEPHACEAVKVRAMYLDAFDEQGRGRFGAAATVLETVVAEQPVHAAAQFALAYCRHQRGEHHAALERYQVAAGLLPTDPRPAFSRGQVFNTLNRPERAEAEFTAALKLDPDHTDALVYRALARLRLARDTGDRARLAGAEADLARALECGAPPVFAHSVRAGVREVAGDRTGARADRTAARALVPKFERDFMARGWDRLASDPLGALADFRAAAECNPRSVESVFNQVFVLSERLNDPDWALAVADRAVKMSPEFALPRAGRAVLLARAGRRADAHAEIAKARELSSEPEITFLAACVYSLTSRTDSGDRATALAHLRRAVREGYWDTNRFATDPDLVPLADDAELRAIRESVSRLAR